MVHLLAFSIGFSILWIVYWNLQIKMQRQEWNYDKLSLTSKKAHSRNIVGVKVHDQNTFLTSSEDSTVRLWDVRVNASVKLITNKQLSEEISNPASNSNHKIFIASSKSLFTFDMRKQLVFVEQIQQITEQKHHDDINRIKYSPKYNQVLCCDDQGDIRVYDADSLQCRHILEQEHINICNDVGYVYSDHKDFDGKKVCVSGGFDSTLIIWNMEEQKPRKKIPIIDIFKKYELAVDGEFFIHQITTHQSSILLALESGYLMCMPVYEPRKPKFMMQASLARLTSCSVVNFSVNPTKKFLITSDIFNTFSIFDYQQRVNNQPKFLIKYKTQSEPIEVETIGNTLLVATADPTLSIYSIKS